VSENKPQYDQTTRLAGLVGQIGCVTGLAAVIIIGVAFGLGRLVDSWLGTDGIATILFLIGTFPITLYVIVRISMYALKRAQAPASGSQRDDQNNPAATEEEKSK
jgi:F0F1-type ATP synthase assembly protein I